MPQPREGADMIQIYILDVLLSLWFTCAILDWEINFLAICAMSLSLQQRLSSEVLWFVGLWVLTREDKYFQCYLRNDMKEEEVNLTEPWRKICSINYHFVKPLIISHQLVSNSCITVSQWRLRGIIFRIHTIFRRALVYEDLCDSGQVMTHMNPHFRRKMLLVNFPFG